MTDADRPAFLEAIAKLAVALREHEPDVVQMQVYFDDLADLPIELVAAAADELRASTQWFPKVPEWRAAALAIARRRAEAQREHLRKAPQPVCGQCSDTGWRPVDETNRVIRCACQSDRALERLGHRELPALPPVDAAYDPTQFERIKAMVASAIKPIPGPRRPLITPEFEKAAESDPILAAELERKRKGRPA